MRTAEERRALAKGKLKAAGVAVVAADTGRVLMLQRHPDDPHAGGTWEFPGGKLEDDEPPHKAAFREWKEETGLRMRRPSEADIEKMPTWDARNGKYKGYVHVVPSESKVNIFTRDMNSNPDDPKGKMPEAVAWWDLDHLRGNSAVRPELQADMDRVVRAIRPVARRVIAKTFNPDEPRDFHGRWSKIGAEVKHTLKADAEKTLADNPAYQAAKQRRAAAKWQKVQDAAQRALDNAEKQLTSEQYTNKQHFPSGMGDVQIFTLADGSKAVLKTTNHDYEVAAEIIGSRLAQRMGLQAPTVKRIDTMKLPRDIRNPDIRNKNTQGTAGMLMSYVDGNTAWDHFNDRISLLNAYESKEGNKIGLLDTIIQNMDRHEGNWMVTPDGHLAPIDHGNAMFSMENRDKLSPDVSEMLGVPHTPMPSGWYAPASQFADSAHLYQEQRGIITKWLDHDYTKADIQKLRNEVMSLEEEFSKLPLSADDLAAGVSQNTSKMQAVLDRLNQLEAHATGTVDLLP